MNPSSTSDDSLISEIVAGDEVAFRTLYRRHTPSMFAFALRLAAGDEHQAGELIQDAWIRAVASFHRFRKASALRTWLIGILLNCHREHRRREQRHLHLVAHDDSVPMSGAVPEIEVALSLEAAVRSLPDGYREVFILHDVEGYAHHEIAEMLDIHPGTSKSQLSRARKTLRAKLAECGREGDAV